LQEKKEHGVQPRYFTAVDGLPCKYPEELQVTMTSSGTLKPHVPIRCTYCCI